MIPNNFSVNINNKQKENIMAKKTSGSAPSTGAAASSTGATERKKRTPRAKTERELELEREIINERIVGKEKAKLDKIASFLVALQPASKKHLFMLIGHSASPERPTDTSYAGPVTE